MLLKLMERINRRRFSPVAISLLGQGILGWRIKELDAYLFSTLERVRAVQIDGCVIATNTVYTIRWGTCRRCNSCHG